jgi:hypothetical protein
LTVGTVKAIKDHIVSQFDCDAKVIWREDEPMKRYRVGREGKVDIKFTKPAKRKYFEDHLQEITEGSLFEF